MPKRIVILLGLIAALSGCERVQDYYYKQVATNMPTIVFPAGTKVQSGEHELVIWGDAPCSDNEGFMGALFGNSPDAGKHDCIAIQKDQTNVTVHFASKETGIQSEKWSVLRNGKYKEQIGLQRPNGVIVGRVSKS